MAGKTQSYDCADHSGGLVNVQQPALQTKTTENKIVVFTNFFDAKYSHHGQFQAINKLWKILKEMGIPDHLTWLLRNLYAGQEVTVRMEHGTTDWFQVGKGAH